MENNTFSDVTTKYIELDSAAIINGIMKKLVDCLRNRVLIGVKAGYGGNQDKLQLSLEHRPNEKIKQPKRPYIRKSDNRTK